MLVYDVYYPSDKTAYHCYKNKPLPWCAFFMAAAFLITTILTLVATSTTIVASLPNAVLWHSMCIIARAD